MLATPHMLVGAAVARKLGTGPAGLTAAFLSHFVLDFVPHLDSHRLLGAPVGGPTKPEAVMAICDFLIGCGLLVWLARHRAQGRAVLLGGLMGVLIDLLDNVPPWSHFVQQWPGTLWLSEFHHRFQHNVRPDQWALGFGAQLAVMIAALWILRPSIRLLPELHSRKEE